MTLYISKKESKWLPLVYYKKNNELYYLDDGRRVSVNLTFYKKVSISHLLQLPFEPDSRIDLAIRKKLWTLYIFENLDI